MILNKKLRRDSPMILREIRMMLIISLLLPCRSYGQPYGSYSGNREMVYVHLDKQAYVTGEEMRYKVYAVNANNPGQKPSSNILYFTLTSLQDKKVVDWRIHLQDGSAMGQYVIPGDLKTGCYIFNAYTSWMRNGPPGLLYSTRLLITNLSESIPDTLMVVRKSLTEGRTDDSNRKPMIKLGALKASYKVNEKVTLEIRLEGNNQSAAGADLSVSVAAESPFEDMLGYRNIVSWLSDVPAKEGFNNPPGSFPCQYRMENKGYILSGSVRNSKDNTLLANGSILLSVIDSLAPSILYSRTDSAGRFLFYLNRFYDNRELILQAGNLSKDNGLKWELDTKIIQVNQRMDIPQALNSGQMEFLNTSRNIRLIDAVYVKRLTPGRTGEEVAGRNSFIQPDRIVYPGEYADLVNFKEIADNILPEVKFTLRNDSYSLFIFNAKSATWNECNMVLLNGVPCNDLSFIAPLGTKAIKRIEIISSTFFMGDLTFPGLVSIYTLDHNAAENYLKKNTYRYDNTVLADGSSMVSFQDDPDGKLTEHMPDFRSVLCWKPDVRIKEKESLVIEFPVSMLTGTYIIKVEGLTAEGYPVSTSASFEVKE